MEIYAQVLKRRDRRRHGEAFDALMADAVPSRRRSLASGSGLILECLTNAALTETSRATCNRCSTTTSCSTTPPAPCAHQSGNQYVCTVTTSDGQQTTVSVTDDGHTISEQASSIGAGQ